MTIEYCEKCKTPRQKLIKVESLGIEKIVDCLCKCEQEQWEKDNKERLDKEKADAVKRLKIDGVRDKALRGYTLDVDNGNNKQMTSLCEKYTKAFCKDSKGLLFYGDVGNGKTFFAACIGNALIEKNIRVMITDFSRVLNMLQDNAFSKNEVLDQFSHYQLLIIDDLGVERQSDYALEQVYTVIDQRYKSGKPLIITTNLSMAEMSKPKDIKYSRIYDRILEMCVPIKFTGDSIRIQHARENQMELKEILNG